MLETSMMYEHTEREEAVWPSPSNNHQCSYSSSPALPSIIVVVTKLTFISVEGTNA